MAKGAATKTLVEKAREMVKEMMAPIASKSRESQLDDIEKQIETKTSITTDAPKEKKKEGAATKNLKK